MELTICGTTVTPTWMWLPFVYFGIATVLFLRSTIQDVRYVRMLKQQRTSTPNQERRPHVDGLWRCLRESALTALMWGPILAVLIIAWWPRKRS